mmetsp:Transcript_30389/g.62617  ORF Transcript_30389/g.62617 Transcript_30389/m.62617 type:complete len:278 (+) Transcript_30389:7578-8411(+)
MDDAPLAAPPLTFVELPPVPAELAAAEESPPDGTAWSTMRLLPDTTSASSAPNDASDTLPGNPTGLGSGGWTTTAAVALPFVLAAAPLFPDAACVVISRTPPAIPVGGARGARRVPAYDPSMDLNMSIWCPLENCLVTGSHPSTAVVTDWISACACTKVWCNAGYSLTGSVSNWVPSWRNTMAAESTTSRADSGVGGSAGRAMALTTFGFVTTGVVSGGGRADARGAREHSIAFAKSSQASGGHQVGKSMSWIQPISSACVLTDLDDAPITPLTRIA